MKGYKPTKIMVIMSAFGASVGGIILLKEYAGGCHYTGKETLANKRVIITGANRGIGKEVARDLAARGARLILACRDMESCDAVRKELILESKNKHIKCRKLNLGSLKSIHEFAAVAKNEIPELNLLINNAGVYKDKDKRELTEDGFEIQLGVNHLGHFLLTNLLLPNLESGQPSRIINVSSVAHTINETIDFDNLNWDRNYNARYAYGQSKLANVLFTKELAKRLKDSQVTACAVHPGLVKTDLFKEMSYNNFFASRWLVNCMLWLVMKSSRRGAQPVIYCALSDQVQSGKYYSNCREMESSDAAKDEIAANRLWKISEKWVRLT